MKTLKNIQVKEEKIIVGFEENAEFKTVESTVDVSEVTDIVNSRLKPDETLKEYLCQVTEDQHLSEERIRYVLDNDSYRFLAVSNMTFTEQEQYVSFKQSINEKINLQL
jgi:Fe-S cluster assembly iron-binding protein IscA